MGHPLMGPSWVSKKNEANKGLLRAGMDGGSQWLLGKAGLKAALRTSAEFQNPVNRDNFLFRSHRHEDPTNHGSWNPHGPWKENVRAFCLCGLWGPYDGFSWLDVKQSLQSLSRTGQLLTTLDLSYAGLQKRGCSPSLAAWGIPCLDARWA